MPNGPDELTFEEATAPSVAAPESISFEEASTPELTPRQIEESKILAESRVAPPTAPRGVIGPMPGISAYEPTTLPGGTTLTPPEAGVGIPYVKPPETAGPVEKVAAGAVNVLAGIPNFLLSPAGIATAVLPEVALPARLAAPALKVGFGALMAKTTLQAVDKALQTKDPQDIAEAIGAGGFTALIARGRADPEFQKEVLRQRRLKEPSALPPTISSTKAEKAAAEIGGWKFDGETGGYKIGEVTVPKKLKFTRTVKGEETTVQVSPKATPEEIKNALKSKAQEFAVEPEKPSAAPIPPTAPAAGLPPLRPDPPVPESKFPDLPGTDNKLITIQRRDGTTYRAAMNTKVSWPKEALPPGVESGASIHRVVVDEKGVPNWSTGMLDPGEKILGAKAPTAEVQPAAITPEKITAAAYRTPEGKIETGANHPEILDRLGVPGFETAESRNTAQFGFVTDKGRFITREEAGPISKASGQALKDFEPGEPVHSDEVASPTEPEKPLGEAEPVGAGRVYAFGPIGHVATWLGNIFKTDRASAEVGPNSPPPSRRRLVANLTERILNPDAAERVDALSRQVAGESIPKTMAASPDSGNAMVRFASATVAAPHVARSMTREVLGDRWKDQTFRDKLGAVLVEDRLRAIRKGIQDAAMRETDPDKVAELVDQAGKVNRLTGEGKPFANEDEFRAALNDPEIKAAIARHKATVQAQAEKFHIETGGQMAGPGLNTGAFVNLQPIFEDAPQVVFSGATKGDYTRPFKRKSVFSQRAKGTAEKYELDYGTLAERMIRGNFEEYTKRQLYDQLVKDGLAVVEGPGVPRPTFEGKPAVKFQILRRGAPPGRTLIENLWVRPDIAPELRAAENLDGPIRGAAFTRVANALNAIQLAGPTDATWHIANMMSSISASQGGKNLLVDLARKVPLANVIDSATRVTLAARKVLQNDPQVLRKLSDLSQIGAVRPERAGGRINSRIISLLDRAGRVVRDNMYQNLVERGLVKPSEEGRREWVNQMGQYNPRMMGQFQAFFKEAGLSPFIVAGRNFNRLALRRVTLSPGIRAANLQSAVQMRAVEAFGILATLLAVPAVLNSVIVGKPSGRAGVPFGGVDTGKDDKNGKPIYIDPAQWIGLRRGMRLTGINAAIEGIRKGETTRRISQRAGQDIIGAAVHPWAGPAVQAPVILATGKTTSAYKESKDPGDYWENFKAALFNINPLLHGWMKKQGKGVVAGVESAVRSLTGAAGLKTGPRVTATQEVRQLATSWMDRSADPKIKHKLEVAEKQDFGESDYKALRRGLDQGDLETSIAEYRKLLSEGKKPMDVLRTIRPFTVTEVAGQYFRHEKPIAGLSQPELQKFLKSLTPEQRKTYERSKTERLEQFRKFQDMLKRERESRPSRALEPAA